MINLVSFNYVDGGDGVKINCDRYGEKHSLTVSSEDFLSLGIVKGAVTDFEFIEIQRAALYYKAYASALRMLSSSQCSKKRLCDKLRAKGFSHEAALFASEKVQNGGYIDEKKQIESYLRELVGRRFCGRRKVVPYLLVRGYRAADINEVLDENYSESDFSAAKTAFLEKRFGKTHPESAEEAAEMKKALYKQGY